MIKSFLKYLVSNIALPDKVVWHGDKNTNLISLTFDDGPNSVHTFQVLRALEEIDAKATFFLLGKNITKHKDVLQEIINQGHEIATHTYSHLSMRQVEHNKYIYDVENCENLLKEYNIEPKLFRPPYGDIAWFSVKNVLKGRKIILWNRDTMDYSFSDIDTAWEYSDKLKIESGDIFLLHDVYEHTAEIVLRLGEKAKNKGLKIVPVSKMMNWDD